MEVIEGRFKNLINVVNALPLLVTYIDDKQVVQFKNRAFQIWLGNTSDNSTNQLRDLLPAKVYQQLSLHLRSALSGQRTHFTLYNNSKGPIEILSITCIPDEKADKKIKGVFLVMEDITDSTLTEKALQLNNDRINTLLTASQAVIFSCSFYNYHQFGYVGSNVTKLLGYEPYQFVDHPNFWLEKLHPEDRVKVEQNLTSATLQDELRLEYRMKTYCGKYIWIHDVRTLISDENNEIQEIIGYWSDISEVKSTEHEIMRVKQRAELADKFKNEFLINMGHEIRTPINGVLGSLGFLQQTDLDEKQKSCIDMAMQSAHQLLALVNDVLDFSEIEGGQLILDHVEFDIHRVLEDVRTVYVEAASEKAIQIVIEIDPTIPQWLMGDPSRLRQVLINLVSNAVKFTKEGSITIKLNLLEKIQPSMGKPQQFKLLLEVIDTGVGIPLTLQENLFEPFIQIDGSTTREHGGMGLGLALTKRLIKAIGGEIAVDSNSPQGTKFLCEFTLQQKSQPIFFNRLWDKSYNVLVAEDHLINQKVAMLTLEQFGFHVDVVSNGQQAVEAVNANQYDLILMDCHMPVLDGYGATRAIRALPNKNSKVPIIAITASAILEDREKCLAIGMNDYLTKPFEQETLLRSIQQCLV